MEMRNIIEVGRQRCLEEISYVRKGLRNLATADATMLSMILLPMKSKCNFLMESLNICNVLQTARDSGRRSLNSYILFNGSKVLLTCAVHVSYI